MCPLKDASGQTVSADAALQTPSGQPGLYFTMLSHDLSGRRTSGQTLIESFQGGNLGVLTSAYVDHVVFCHTDTATASGVQLASGRMIRLRVGGEVLLTAGVYETPTLLQRSGVGPASVLTRMGQDCHLSVPSPAAEQVGRNFWSNLVLPAHTQASRMSCDAAP